ncbi:RmlC-like cupins superfamily protein [Rhynchospora pubera]|uniref:RmlC-like cupins superfamily protein n=1 Tax=Rhynchospora pubera TaxID=906938 RepID=A0AAV8GAY2_9POAL|nr:RmlC-like cupins superfamily protein [Rhynchospora pubera]
MGSSSNTEAMDTDAPSLSITVERNPSQARLQQLGIKSWPKWGCPPGKFPVKFDAQQTCYFLRGKIKAYIKGSNECVEIGAGDLVVFPKGISCTWDVSVAVDKHYKFDPS